MTLLELLVTMVAASILVLTAGLMLVQASIACQRDREGVNMQADGRVAMETLARIVRASSAVEVSVTSASPGDLRVTQSGVTRRVYASGGDLIYDPDMAQGGDLVPLVDGRLSSFVVGKTNSSVAVTLSMAAGNNTHTETLRGVFTCRN